MGVPVVLVRTAVALHPVWGSTGPQPMKWATWVPDDFADDPLVVRAWVAAQVAGEGWVIDGEVIIERMVETVPFETDPPFTYRASCYCVRPGGVQDHVTGV